MLLDVDLVHWQWRSSNSIVSDHKMACLFDIVEWFLLVHEYCLAFVCIIPLHAIVADVPITPRNILENPQLKDGVKAFRCVLTSP